MIQLVEPIVGLSVPLRLHWPPCWPRTACLGGLALNHNELQTWTNWEKWRFFNFKFIHILKPKNRTLHFYYNVTRKKSSFFSPRSDFPERRNEKEHVHHILSRRAAQAEDQEDLRGVREAGSGSVTSARGRVRPEGYDAKGTIGASLRSVWGFRIIFPHLIRECEECN